MPKRERLDINQRWAKKGKCLLIRVNGGDEILSVRNLKCKQRPFTDKKLSLISHNPTTTHPIINDFNALVIANIAGISGVSKQDN
ncbi:hypothetical protein [Xenorhabdus sp. PB30.3]|uniref:hypothetical protein n=1 Tax=Xenorhabdus sp. PB30.3 TaxID=2788941 RepID=UPI001E46D207|nr:hypothetical protein [Xenorhabdus sp. PB30.3]MCC8380466.1 hypothetical protein [Xenorhabdus sp. PB30.3]